MIHLIFDSVIDGEQDKRGSKICLKSDLGALFSLIGIIYVKVCITLISIYGESRKVIFRFISTIFSI